MTAEQILRAINLYCLSVMGPTGTNVHLDKRWIARSPNGKMMGFGRTAEAAVEAAVSSRETRHGGDR